MTKEKGIRSVAITYTKNDYGKGLAKIYGASLKALIKLMNQKEYVFVGSNIACFNAFFVLESEVEKLNLNLPDKNDLTKYTTSYIRESRSIKNRY